VRRANAPHSAKNGTERTGFGLNRLERQALLHQAIEENPFVTDEQLAAQFSVSVATIRLDRQMLSIPEARERIRRLAEGLQDSVRALEADEVVGVLSELSLNHFAVSKFTVERIHVFSRTEVARGHFLFAQINSLATALIDAKIALTARSELRFYRPVFLGDTVTAKVEVIAQRGRVSKCKAVSYVRDNLVLGGLIWMLANPLAITERFPSAAWVTLDEEDMF
jgi:acyl dehydratase